jgi:hypothetical protein
MQIGGGNAGYDNDGIWNWHGYPPFQLLELQVFGNFIASLGIEGSLVFGLFSIPAGSLPANTQNVDDQLLTTMASCSHWVMPIS